MKKIITPAIHEEASYFCDKHPERECFTEIRSSCWYGSGFDMNNIKMNLCDECMEEFYKIIKEKFGVEPFYDELSLYNT